MAMMIRSHIVDPLEAYLAPTERSGGFGLEAAHLSGRWPALGDEVEVC